LPKILFEKILLLKGYEETEESILKLHVWWLEVLFFTGDVWCSIWPRNWHLVFRVYPGWGKSQLSFILCSKSAVNQCKCTRLDWELLRLDIILSELLMNQQFLEFWNLRMDVSFWMFYFFYCSIITHTILTSITNVYV